MMERCSDSFTVHQCFCPAKMRGARSSVPHPLALLTSPLQQRPVGRLKSLFKEGIVIKDQRERVGRESRGPIVLQVRLVASEHCFPKRLILSMMDDGQRPSWDSELVDCDSSLLMALFELSANYSHIADVYLQSEVSCLFTSLLKYVMATLQLDVIA